MIKQTQTFFRLSFCSLLLFGCMPHDQAGKKSIEFGNSVKQNIAAQIVNPDSPGGLRTVSHSGARTALAQDRYLSDKAEKAEVESTSSSSGGG
ncbi:MAG: hypothetical protein COA45_03120 [Zetaproteobacteria bacterium]|nr:MAG: hypothetical protein COA45_03120 [Zetaproteobacteria bacterium]